MGVRILTDVVDDMAALYCSTNMRAFGPVFNGPDAEGRAQAFLDWLRENPQSALAQSDRDGTDARDFAPIDLARLVADWADNYEGVAS